MWVPTAREEVFMEACPVPSSATGMPGTPSTVKVTEPVGVGWPGGTDVTAAVSATSSPNTDGFTLEVTVVSDWDMRRTST